MAILGSWSGMRKYLEQEMLADSLKGRIQYKCTSCTGMDDRKLFEISVNDTLIKRFSWETVNNYFINNNLKENNTPYGDDQHWQGFWELLDKIPPDERTEYTDEEFCNALEIYRNQDIQASIDSNNPMIRMFAVLDRRLGKRTLIRIKATINSQPPWLQELYILRINAEGV